MEEGRKKQRKEGKISAIDCQNIADISSCILMIQAVSKSVSEVYSPGRQWMGSISDSQLDTIGWRIINKGDGNRVTRSNARCIENGVTSLESRDRLNSMAGKREKIAS